MPTEGKSDIFAKNFSLYAKLNERLFSPNVFRLSVFFFCVYLPRKPCPSKSFQKYQQSIRKLSEYIALQTVQSCSNTLLYKPSKNVLQYITHLHIPLTSLFFSSIYDLVAIPCKQYNRNALNPFLNCTKNNEVDALV